MSFDYLDLLSKKLDNIQKISCCSTGNIISAAGAGSGKTQVLATRFAWLVMSMNIPVSQILTLTFTKKAAGEMYERIYSTLHFFANNPETPKTEKERAKKALEDFTESKIQTLDSYCNGIVKQAANLYGIRPDFTSGTEDSEKTIKDLALPFIFKNKDSLAVENLTKAGAYQDFSDNIFSNLILEHTSLATEKDYFKTFITEQKKFIIKAFNFFILNKGESVPEFYDYQKEYEYYFNKNKLQIHISLVQILKKIYEEKDSSENKEKYEQLPLFNEKDQTYLIQLISKLKKEPEISENDKDAIKKILVYKNDIIYLKSVLKQINLIQFQKGDSLKIYCKFLRDILINLYESIYQFINDYDSIFNFAELADDFTQIVNKNKRESGKLTFKDISELALKILKENEDIRKQEQEAYKSIMIDEFQDNNAKNKELLFLLSQDQEKLFFVGDEKQSIYKFRGADVSVFNKLKSDPKVKSVKPMTYNYRSTIPIITSFNKMFGETNFIFDNTTKYEFEATYKQKAYKYNPEQQKIEPEVPLTKDTVPVHICMLNKSRIEENKKIILPDEQDRFISNKDQLGYFIAKKIKELIEKNPSLKYNQIAILDRNRTDRFYLTKWLNNFNIPYNLDQTSSIFSEGPINDIYNYLRLCIYPSDKEAYAGYIASPFNGDSFSTITQKIADFKKMNLPDQKEILKEPITKTLSKLWINYGYYYETILNINTTMYEEQFDMIYELGRNCDENGKSISWFIDQLSIIKDKENKFFNENIELDVKNIEYPIEKNDAIQIMTIHKSKGLQFEHVFIYSITNFSPKCADSSFFEDDIFGPTFQLKGKNNNFFFLIAKLKEERKELAEFRRLLYVAITRAINSIYIIGEWNPDSNSFLEIKDFKVDYKLIERITNHYYADKIISRDEKETINFNNDAPFDYQNIVPVSQKDAYSKNKTQQKKDFQYLNTIFEYYQNEPCIKMPELISNRKTPSSLEIQSSDSQTYDSDSGEKFEFENDYLSTGKFTSADFGTLVHSYLEAQANNIAPQDYEPSQKLLKNLSEKEREEKINECIKMCQDFKNSEVGKLFDDAKNNNRFFKAEYGFRMLHEGIIFTGSIDLIFENADGTFTLIDYKSDNEINTEKYKPQQSCYRTAASKLLGIKENQISCSLYFLKHRKEEKLFNE